MSAAAHLSGRRGQQHCPHHSTIYRCSHCCDSWLLEHLAACICAPAAAAAAAGHGRCCPHLIAVSTDASVSVWYTSPLSSLPAQQHTASTHTSETSNRNKLQQNPAAPLLRRARSMYLPQQLTLTALNVSKHARQPAQLFCLKLLCPPGCQAAASALPCRRVLSACAGSAHPAP